MEQTETKSNVNKELLQLVSFKLDTAEFGIDISKVQEIHKMLELTKVPNTPSFIEGVVNFRNKVISVLCLRKKMGLDPKNYDSDTRIIVSELDGKTIGFIVDNVKEVLRIPKNIIEPPPDIVSGVQTDYITAIAKLEDRLLILLDLEKILSDEEIEQIDN